MFIVWIAKASTKTTTISQQRCSTDLLKKCELSKWIETFSPASPGTDTNPRQEHERKLSKLEHARYPVSIANWRTVVPGSLQNTGFIPYSLRTLKDCLRPNIETLKSMRSVLRYSAKTSANDIKYNRKNNIKRKLIHIPIEQAAMPTINQQQKRSLRSMALSSCAKIIFNQSFHYHL